MILLEVFSSPYSYKLDGYEKMRNLEVWVYVFTASDSSVIAVEIHKNENNAIDVAFDRNGHAHITNTGDAYRIFATVIAILTEFVKEHKPVSVRFTASKLSDDEETLSRVKLYDRLVNRFAGKLGYSMEQYEHDSEVIYYLNRNRS